MKRTCRAELELEMPAMKCRFELLCKAADAQGDIVMQLNGQVAQYKIDELAQRRNERMPSQQPQQ